MHKLRLLIRFRIKDRDDVTTLSAELGVLKPQAIELCNGIAIDFDSPAGYPEISNLSRCGRLPLSSVDLNP